MAHHTLQALLVLSALTVTSCATWSARALCADTSYVDALGACSQEQASYHIPFRAGYKTRVTQGFHGNRTHGDEMPYALDFACEEGDPIVAARDGIVWEMREDSAIECDDPSCASEANYVIIDHGDGTFAGYHHLTPYGVIVEPGEAVCAGQVIGLCGKSGYTAGPHLHWELTDSTQRTIPARFDEATGSHPQGWVTPRTRYISRNERTYHCEAPSYSQLGRASFAHQGVTLKEPLPRILRGDTPTLTIEGTYHGDLPRVTIHRKSVAQAKEAWRVTCLTPKADGSFRAEVTWEAEMFTPGRQWLMITGADASCEGPGWAWSYWLQWRRHDGAATMAAPPPAAERTRPRTAPGE